MGPNYLYDTYVFHWTAAVKGEDAYGTPVNADYNGDGLITMDEAYRYAEVHDLENEDPQYDDYPNGVGQGISLWPTGIGPFLSVQSSAIDDIGGNNNGAADPGETVSLTITLINVGNSAAANISGLLSTTDPYLTITQNNALYPDLASFQQGAGTPDYIIDINDGCPQGQVVACNLHLTADSNYVNDITVSFIVGDIIYSPSGPDDYGYLAYDPYDVPELPQYEWIEICPDSGGQGTEVPFDLDDQVLCYALPFEFVYYGVIFDSLSIATDGWIALGVTTQPDYSNSAIPNSDGPASMVAAYWEDMSPQRANSGGVWQWYDDVNHRYIVEFNYVEQYAPTRSFETFQSIFYDPAFYPTISGDGKIKMQYKSMSASLANEGTVGIEDPSETDGIQYLFDGAYDVKAHPITNQFCILYLPSLAPPELMVIAEPINPPIIIPAAGGTFSFHVEITNAGASTANFDVWTMLTLPSGAPYGPILLRQNINLVPQLSILRDLSQFIPGGAPAGTYTYWLYTGNYISGALYASDSFNFQKSATDAAANSSDWSISGWDGEEIGYLALPTTLCLSPAFPNPFNPQTELRYSLPQAGEISLIIYDIQGREVARVLEGIQPAGVHSVTFDASRLSCGIYFARLTAGKEKAVQKLLLLK